MKLTHMPSSHDICTQLNATEGDKESKGKKGRHKEGEGKEKER